MFGPIPPRGKAGVVSGGQGKRVFARRPRFGPADDRRDVALGGGSARGIAHVGVIRWLEEHRIPIDVAAGTSMGGLVGGAFASAMDGPELQAFIAGLNWDQLFGVDVNGRQRGRAR